MKRIKGDATMKNITKRILTTMLAVLMLIGAIPAVLSYADEATVPTKTYDFEADTVGEKPKNFTIDTAPTVEVVEELGAELSPVGECFYEVYEKHPEIELYDPDGSHPSYTGSAFAAICHYCTVFGELPKKCDTLNISPEWVNLFKDTVNHRVFG